MILHIVTNVLVFKLSLIFICFCEKNCKMALLMYIMLFYLVLYLVTHFAVMGELNIEFFTLQRGL